MAIDLNSIISNSNSVDDLMGALKEESTGAKQASAQLQQLYAAADGVANSGSWLDKLKSAISPGSTAGKLQYNNEYNAYVLEMTSKGEAPLTKEEFMQRVERMKAAKTRT